MSDQPTDNQQGRRQLRPNPDTLATGPDVPFEEKQRQLEGRKPADQQGEPFIDLAETDDLGSLTVTNIDQDELEAGVDDNLPDDPDTIELLTERELRDGETGDPFEAIQEGLPYVPPTDPPTVPDPSRRDGVEVASGMGGSSLEQPYDSDQHRSFYPDEDEMTTRVRDALRADSRTSTFADQVMIITRDSVVILRGEVDDLIDSDHAAAVATFVDGVEEVIDELTIRSIGA